MKIMNTLWRNDAVEMGSARAPRAVFRALAEHKEDVRKIRSLLSGLRLTPTGEGAGRNTRGRVCSLLFAESFALGRRVLALMACCAALLLLTSALKAQTFTVLKSFGILTNVTGWHSEAPLTLGPDGTLYGTTSYGEGNVRGVVFKIQPDGSGFAVLKLFTNPLQTTGSK